MVRFILISGGQVYNQDLENHAEKTMFTNDVDRQTQGFDQPQSAMQIELKRLTEVKLRDLVDLMTHPSVRRQMPLTRDSFTEEDAAAFVVGKEALWAEHGYGPWAFFIDGQFAGWGGLQPEGDDVDLGLVLHPHYWGAGKALYDQIMAHAFGELDFKSVTILFPPSRTRVKAVLRLGFIPDGELAVGGERFIRYRLDAATYRSQQP